MRYQVIILLFIFQLSFLISAEPTDTQIDDELEDAMEEIDEENEGIKQSPHELNEISQNFMHGSDTLNPSHRESQHIKSPDSTKFQQQNQFQSNERTNFLDSKTDTHYSSRDKVEQSNEEFVEQEMNSNNIHKSVKNDDLHFEESEIGDETLTDHVLRLSEKLKADLGKAGKKVSVEMDQFQKVVDSKLNSMRDILEQTSRSDIIGKPDAIEADKDQSRIDSVTDKKEPASQTVNNAAESEMTETFSYEQTDEIPNTIESIGLDDEVGKSVTDKIKMLSKKVLESEHILDGLEEHDDPEFPEDLEEEFTDSDDEEELDTAKGKEYYELTTEERSASESKAILDSKHKQEDYLQQLDKGRKERRSSEGHPVGGKMADEEYEGEALVDQVLKLSEKLKAEVDKVVTAEMDHLHKKMDDEFALLEKELEKMTGYENTGKDTELADFKGKSSDIPVRPSTTVTLGYTPPPKVNLEPSETESLLKSKTVNAYTELPVDESVKMPTPTIKTMQDSSVDTSIQSSSAGLHVTPTQYIHPSAYETETSASSIINGDNAKVGDTKSSLQDDASTESVHTETDNIQTLEERVERTVSKTEHAVEPRSSDFKSQDHHSATPSHKSVSSEVILQSEHTATANVEETRKHKKDISGTVNKIIEENHGAQTATLQTQFKPAGKQKL